MLFTALSCPQCGAPLPRQASWRTVSCAHCGATVTRSKSVVEAARFREARARVYAQACSACAPALRVVNWRTQRFRILAPLGRGEHAEVYLAERMGPLPQRLTLKLGYPEAKPGVLAAEADVLASLQQSSVQGAAYYTQHLPRPMAAGVTDDGNGPEREVLLLCHPSGYWGSLADVMHYAPTGIDPRHAVWIWRRILEVLAFVHASAWTHGDLAPEHLLAHPRDHGVLIIGWSRAQPIANSSAVARDLMQSAWVIRALLCCGDDRPTWSERIPAPLAELLRRSSEEAAWCARAGARGLDEALVVAAREAFGPARFIPFNPTAAYCV